MEAWKSYRGFMCEPHWLPQSMHGTAIREEPVSAITVNFCSPHEFVNVADDNSEVPQLSDPPADWSQ